jgi:Leucine-rich repeat (LRR) protein
LDSLYINNNKFISIDVSKNTALKTLNAHHNKLTVLNLSANTALTNLDVSYNYLSYVTGWSGDIGFQYLLGDISGDFTDENFLNKVRSTLGITVDAPIYKENVGGITSLNVRNSNIKNLAGIEHLTALKVLDASNNQLTEIDISKNTALTTLLLTRNKLASIDVTKNTALNWLDVSDNQLTSIDVSKNTALDDFKVNNNKLTTLSVKNLNLSSFDCSYNYLKQVTGWSGDIGFQYEPTPILKIATASSILAHAMGNSIVLQNLPSGAKVEVFDLRGKLISGKSFNRGNRGSDMSISVHAKGVYIVKVSSGSAKQVVRVAVR